MQIPEAIIETKGGIALAIMTTKIKSIEMEVTATIVTVVTHLIIVLTIVNMTTAPTIETIEITSLTSSDEAKETNCSIICAKKRKLL